MVNAELQAKLRAEAARLGFVACGFASAAPDPQRAARLEEFLGQGRHGSMEWMEARKGQRASPQGLWPDARSVIALGMGYAPDGDPLALADMPEKARISVYAQGRDYHDVVKKALKALARWLIEREPESELKVFVDTAPVMEKPLGQAAGIGWQGKHTNLVSRDHGSWLFLGAIYSTLDFVPDAPGTDRCGSCRACQDACPTDAFPSPYVLDARRCISYLTIEHKGEIDEDMRPLLGNRIYGCDDCLAVCPWNKFADAAHAHTKLLPREELIAPDLATFLAFDDAGFRQFFSGSPIKRVGRDRFVRNCLYATGNSGSKALAPVVRHLCSDNDPVVAEAAQWAFARLSASP
ncbi:tRNA epoxyqueuosine(34) reductase QueG [Qipengyuania qiaonensis]|uniref:Epoxyqueuosine reductase n=1 Tax=Qipengyuania qiaonensis TaxID=2867240 RepID=A0ABS7J660_9SPHN|nr:tRNA epoxyqueuosine(34) reductase QueG [Qipengyuania qiaonensis]MBX7481756.1 tRNA epoxyqueuosine(34) reductase QueG [Qipengyuania qiaonensis]